MNLPPLAGGFVSYYEESSETRQNAHVKPFLDLKRAIAAQLRENQIGTVRFFINWLVRCKKKPCHHKIHWHLPRAERCGRVRSDCCLNLLKQL